MPQALAPPLACKTGRVDARVLDELADRGVPKVWRDSLAVLLNVMFQDPFASFHPQMNQGPGLTAQARGVPVVS